ncbi:hypothetical protein SAV14893_098460 [Streptomyces avermitilis]|uniref:Chaperone DnaJ C-terminal domain-containing protein n=2 Tax=Streptomyces avermitilis TaxID=33903 RepID=A0A146FBY8_STRAW|nr:hypothetical protein SAVERM_1p99 [Streptomyces avermitilis MA-4680 = NBRC 14893]BBJ56427.1 hypothetical protein SAVMC3_90560 [Streptomyces avermitilis]GDY70453.1 hypothetical protein SAV14893_098460 [Streptomyces avermitilis]
MELRYPPLRRRANVALCRFQTVHTDEKGAQACTTCKGEGRIVREQHTYKVRIPAGIEDGQEFRIRELGGPGTPRRCARRPVRHRAHHRLM